MLFAFMLFLSPLSLYPQPRDIISLNAVALGFPLVKKTTADRSGPVRPASQQHAASACVCSPAPSLQPAVLNHLARLRDEETEEEEACRGDVRRTLQVLPVVGLGSIDLRRDGRPC